jgi:hypothetical protein
MICLEELPPGFCQQVSQGRLDMRVTVQVEPGVVRTLTHKRRARGKAGVELCKALDSLSVDLTPLHPGADDETLGSYFAVDVPDSKTAEKVVKRLRPCRGILAAYVKPADALP